MFNTTNVALGIVGLALCYWIVPWCWRLVRMVWTYRQDRDALQTSIDRISNRIRQAAAARAVKRERMPTVACPQCEATCPQGSKDCHSCGTVFREAAPVRPGRDTSQPPGAKP